MPSTSWIIDDPEYHNLQNLANCKSCARWHHFMGLAFVLPDADTISMPAVKPVLLIEQSHTTQKSHNRNCLVPMWLELPYKIGCDAWNLATLAMPCLWDMVATCRLVLRCCNNTSKLRVLSVQRLKCLTINSHARCPLWCCTMHNCWKSERASFWTWSWWDRPCHHTNRPQRACFTCRKLLEDVLPTNRVQKGRSLQEESQSSEDVPQLVLNGHGESEASKQGVLVQSVSSLSAIILQSPSWASQLECLGVSFALAWDRWKLCMILFTSDTKNPAQGKMCNSCQLQVFHMYMQWCPGLAINAAQASSERHSCACDPPLVMSSHDFWRIFTTKTVLPEQTIQHQQNASLLDAYNIWHAHTLQTNALIITSSSDVNPWSLGHLSGPEDWVSCLCRPCTRIWRTRWTFRQVQIWRASMLHW